MAHFDMTTEAILNAVAEQLGRFPSLALATATQDGVSLGVAETMSVWSLQLDALTSNEEEIDRIAYHTGLWHHQIRFGETAQGFARSAPLGPQAQDWKVREIVISELATKLQDAIYWVDANVPEDFRVRLLIVPAYYLHAFWLNLDRENKILVVDRPEGYARLEYQQLYGATEFLRILSQEPPASGFRS